MREIDLLTQEAAADLFGVKTSTLERWRFVGAGPKFVKVGRLVRYSHADLTDYLRKRTRSSTDSTETENTSDAMIRKELQDILQRQFFDALRDHSHAGNVLEAMRDAGERAKAFMAFIPNLHNHE